MVTGRLLTSICSNCTVIWYGLPLDAGDTATTCPRILDSRLILPRPAEERLAAAWRISLPRPCYCPNRACCRASQAGAYRLEFVAPKGLRSRPQERLFRSVFAWELHQSGCAVPELSLVALRQSLQRPEIRTYWRTTLSPRLTRHLI